MNIARIDKATNKVVNMEVWKSIPADTSSHRFVAVSDTETSVGDEYKDNKFKKSAAIEPNPLQLPVRSSHPDEASVGMIYFNSTDNRVYVKTTTDWTVL